MNYSEMKELAKKYNMWHVEGAGKYWIDPFETEQTTPEGKQAQIVLVQEVLNNREIRLAEAIEGMDTYDFPKAARAFIFYYDKCISHGFTPTTKFGNLLTELREIGSLRRIQSGRLLQVYKHYKEI